MPAQEGFKMYLGITPTLTNWSADNKECSLIIDNNPLTTWVELPENHPKLLYSNLICGVIRGALEMVWCRSARRNTMTLYLSAGANEG